MSKDDTSPPSDATLHPSAAGRLNNGPGNYSLNVTDLVGEFDAYFYHLARKLREYTHAFIDGHNLPATWKFRFICGPVLVATAASVRECSRNNTVVVERPTGWDGRVRVEVEIYSATTDYSKALVNEYYVGTLDLFRECWPGFTLPRVTENIAAGETRVQFTMTFAPHPI